MINFMHGGIRADKTRQHSCSLHILDIAEMPPTFDAVKGTIFHTAGQSRNIDSVSGLLSVG